MKIAILLSRGTLAVVALAALVLPGVRSARPADAAISAPVLAQIIAERDRQLLVAEADRTVLGVGA